MIELRSDGISLNFDPDFGMIAGFFVTDLGKRVAPLHKAPWVGTGEEMPQDAAPHLAKLGGDFFCAPFGTEIDGAPLHGWPANARWTIDAHREDLVSATLPKRVSGALLRKTITLKSAHPFVYQEHKFSGGFGVVPFANHANIALKNGGFIRTSRKAIWRTPNAPVESNSDRGRSGLEYPGESEELAFFPATNGVADLGEYPWREACEDFVVGVEGGEASFGWTAVTRPVEGDLFVSLRRADRLPMTMLWHSNGGRDYAPWSGRHLGCLGVEEGAAAHLLGGPSLLPENAAGLVLEPNGHAEVRHVIGAIAWPSGEPVAHIRLDGGDIRIVGERGSSREVPFDAEFLELQADP